jgi:threonine dehydrogenase-like Zn-dependent dehydrogenase
LVADVRASSRSRSSSRSYACWAASPYADEFAEVIALLADGALQVADLTSEIASIDDAPAAFERLRDASTMKILIAPNGP